MTLTRDILSFFSYMLTKVNAIRLEERQHRIAVRGLIRNVTKAEMDHLIMRDGNSAFASADLLRFPGRHEHQKGSIPP